MGREGRAANFVFLEFGLVATRYNRYDDAAFLYHAVGPSERIAAHRNEHKIDIVRDLFEFLFRVIDRHIGAELFQQILIGRGRRRDHASAASFCDLNGETSDTARTPVNQNGLAFVDLADVDQSLPRS